MMELKKLMEAAGVVLPVAYGPAGSDEAIVEDLRGEMGATVEGDLAAEQARYIAALLNAAPALLEAVEALRGLLNAPGDGLAQIRANVAVAALLGHEADTARAIAATQAWADDVDAGSISRSLGKGLTSLRFVPETPTEAGANLRPLMAGAAPKVSGKIEAHFQFREPVVGELRAAVSVVGDTLERVQSLGAAFAGIASLGGEQLQELRRLRAEADIVLPVVHSNNDLYKADQAWLCPVYRSAGAGGDAEARYIAALLNAAPKLLGEDQP